MTTTGATLKRGMTTAHQNTILITRGTHVTKTILVKNMDKITTGATWTKVAGTIVAEWSQEQWVIEPTI